MAEKKEVTTATVTPTATGTDQNVVLERAKGFWAKNSKPIIFIGSAIILLGAVYLGYQKFIKEPKMKEANEMVFLAEGIFDKMASGSFSKDSVNIILNGGLLDGTNVPGLLKVISKYDGTPAANRAKYMTGASYLHLKDFDKAIKYLKDFEGNGAYQIQSKAYLMLGHAYAEKKQTGEAFDYYKKAATVNEKDESISADALLIAGMYADATGKTKEAIELFKKLKEKYPNFTAVSSGEVDKQLARLGELN